MEYYCVLIYFWAGKAVCVIAAIEMLLLISRKVFQLEEHITIDRMELINKIILVGSLTQGIILFATLADTSLIKSQPVFYNRIFGRYYWAYIIMLAGPLIFPHLYWFKKLRRNIYVTFIVAVLINVPIGVWFERLIIILTSNIFS